MDTSRSHDLFTRAQALMPGGVNSPVRAFKSVGGEPFFVQRAEGAHLIDVDGNRYIDYVGSWGPMIVGHNHPAVLDAVIETARNGLSFGTPNPLEVTMAEAIARLVPSCEMVRMLRMPLRRYVPVSLLACVLWAAAFLAPGWIFGKSYDAVAAVADRLALVLCALVAAVALVWAAVLYTWRWFAGHADRLLERALRWSREHPRLARYAGALIDPNRPESASLLILAAALFVIAWA